MDNAINKVKETFPGTPAGTACEQSIVARHANGNKFQASMGMENGLKRQVSQKTSFGKGA